MPKESKDNPEKSKKIIVREIAPKFKVTEIKEENADEAPEAQEESPLEELTTDAPSARMFPESMPLPQTQLPQERIEEPVIPTPAATTETEGRNAIRYQIQTDISEREIKRVYNTQSAESRSIELKNTMLTAHQGRINMSRMANPEVEALRGQTAEQERHYEITPEDRPKAERRKYPWEA